jgi:hypothetical protein
MLKLLELIAKCPAQTKKISANDSLDAVKIIEKIIGKRKHLGLIGDLLRLSQACKRPVLSARAGVETFPNDVLVFSVFLPGLKP